MRVGSFNLNDAVYLILIPSGSVRWTIWACFKNDEYRGLVS